MISRQNHLRLISTKNSVNEDEAYKREYQAKLIDTFMDVLPLKNQSAVQNYSSAINSHFIPWLEDLGKYIWEITPDDFDGFTKYLLKNVKETTAWNYVHYVSQLFDWIVSRKKKEILHKFGEEVRNPKDKWNTPKKKNIDDDLPDLPDQDVVNYYFERFRHELENAITKNHKRNIIIYGRQLAAEQIMVKAGLRVEEVSNLEVNDIDFEHMSIFVYKGKGSKDRIVFMSKELAKVLQWYIQHIHPLLPHANKVRNSAPLFISERGKSVSKKTLGHKNWKLQEDFGVDLDKRFGPHGLRRLFATNLYVELVELKHPDPIMYVKMQLGHVYLSTTLRYCRVPKSFLERKRLDIIKELNTFEAATV